MSKRSLILLLLAGAFAFGAATLARKQSDDNATAAPSNTVNILAASMDITPGKFINTGKHLEWIEWPINNVNEAFLVEGVVNLSILDGSVSRRQILKGEPINQNSLVKSDEGGFMAAVLEPGMRAISVAVDSTTGNAGFISPGDFVDLILTHSVELPNASQQGNEEVLSSETFIEKVRVLAVDQQLDNPENAAILAKTVTMEVTKHQAEKINVAKDLGKISLSLRSLADEVTDSVAEFNERGNYRKFTRDSDVSRILTPTGSTRSTVQIFRGSSHEEVEFNRIKH